MDIIKSKFPFHGIGIVFRMYVLIDKSIAEEKLLKNSIEHFQKNFGNIEKIFYDENRKILAISGSQLKIIERKL